MLQLMALTPVKTRFKGTNLQPEQTLSHNCCDIGSSERWSRTVLRACKPSVGPLDKDLKEPKPWSSPV